MKPRNELCGQSAEPFNIRAGGTYGSLNAIVAQQKTAREHIVQNRGA
jgi:hypothetical protein